MCLIIDAHSLCIVQDVGLCDEGLPTEQVNRSPSSVAPCPQPASLKYYHRQPPEAAMAEVHHCYLTI